MTNWARFQRKVEQLRERYGVDFEMYRPHRMHERTYERLLKRTFPN